MVYHICQCVSPQSSDPWAKDQMSDLMIPGTSKFIINQAALGRHVRVSSLSQRYNVWFWKLTHAKQRPCVCNPIGIRNARPVHFLNPGCGAACARKLVLGRWYHNHCDSKLCWALHVLCIYHVCNVCGQEHIQSSWHSPQWFKLGSICVVSDVTK